MGYDELKNSLNPELPNMNKSFQSNFMNLSIILEILPTILFLLFFIILEVIIKAEKKTAGITQYTLLTNAIST